MLELFTALVGDYLAASNFPLAGTAATAGAQVLGRLLRVRAEKAREILIDEMTRGRSSLHDIPEEDAAAITFRYMRAATEGAARLNLRLLAAVASGKREGEGTYADEFLRWADSLSSLTREEVVVLGVVSHRAAELDYKVARSGHFWTDCLKELQDRHGISPANAEAAAGACLRTGMLQLLGGLLDMGHAYLPSPHLRKLSSLADIEGVLRRDGAATDGATPEGGMREAT